MFRTFHEFVLGGVLVSPFVPYAAAALLIFLTLRPLLATTGFERWFAMPSVALLALYVLILTVLILVA